MLIAAILSWAVAALGLVVGIFDTQLHLRVTAAAIDSRAVKIPVSAFWRRLS